jgi:hypothetical protein
MVDSPDLVKREVESAPVTNHKEDQVTGKRAESVRESAGEVDERISRADHASREEMRSGNGYGQSSLSAFHGGDGVTVI